jgi:anti-sigma B factor antagonist
MLLQVMREVEAGHRVLRVCGEVDMATAPMLRAAVDAELERAVGSLYLDLTQTSFIDSAGVHALVYGSRQAASLGSDLIVLCPRANRPVRRVFDVTQIELVLRVVESFEPAVPPGTS